MRHKLVVLRNMQVSLCSRENIARALQNGALHLNATFHNSSELSQDGNLSLDWYNEMFPRLTKLTNLLENMDLVDGRLVHVEHNSIVTDERLLRRMHHFKALARAFLAHPSVQEEVLKNVTAAMAGRKCTLPVCFTKPIERDPITVNVLTKVCNFLNISAQQRKSVRLMICPQVTQHRIWTSALEEVLKGLKAEMELLDSNGPSKGTFIGRQIVSTCLKFLAETAGGQDEDSSSWMRPKPSKAAHSPSTLKWEEVLEMFNDLINCLRDEKRLFVHVSKLEAMKEGLTQIKGVLVDRYIGYKEVQYHESLVQKKLLKTLGHSSECLFTLLRYYLHGSIQDMEVEVSGGIHEIGDKDKLCMCMGKIITSIEDKMIWHGIKQLDRALGLFNFVWETARMKRKLELQGHLWCVGAESKTLTYKGNLFILHGINGVQLIVVNNCKETLWPKDPLRRRLLIELGPTTSPPSRIWARQGCRFDHQSGRGKCETGDCGGLLQCKGTGGRPPTTVVEMTFGTHTSPLHFYDVSLVDGFNVPVSVVPLGGDGGQGGRRGCGVAACEADLNACCPSWLVVENRGKVVGCKSPCLATGSSRYCCTGEFSGAEKCPSTVFGKLFKAVCPRAYSHPFDEATGLRTCRAPRYVITFCPPT
ncbi:hypothetical protein Cgig2_005717 [Carnegiea gigantea]|uniref:Uncharacterized protein n=1 Tax=Carnegiea gigantea TaxID=171969 RepID=A0A9Q1KHY2_9CARY|nr:hypothetical protein Cgig2_005717 [Carnegiea gigantea]